MKRIAILGAGPIGLEAALAATEQGHTPTLFERGPGVAANVRDWGHVRLFTPWSLSVSPRARARLAATGHEVPGGDACPTGNDLADRVLEPLAGLPELAPHVRLGQRVIAVGRDGPLKHEEIGTGARAEHAFRILVQDEAGHERVETADVVLDCTGTYHNPHALGVGGIPAPGERVAAGRIVRRIPDVSAGAEAWAGAHTLLVGAGHSAQTAARDLAELVRSAPDTRVTWAIRREAPDFGAVLDDPLPERAALSGAARDLARAADTPLDVRLGRSVERIDPADDDRLRVTLRASGGTTESVVVDRILGLTGSVGDASLYRELQVHECWATSGPMKLAAALLGSGSADCLAETTHGAETLLNPEPGFFILGEKSYGRNNTFLMRVGWEQVDEAFSLVGPAPITRIGS